MSDPPMFLSAFRTYGLPELNRSLPRRCAVAVLSAAAVAAISVSLQQFAGMGAPWLLAFLPVIVSAWYGGLGPALLASAVGGAAVVWWFVPAPRLGHLASDAAMPLAAYCLSSLTASLFAEAYQQRLASAHEALSRQERKGEKLQFDLSFEREKAEQLGKGLERESTQRRAYEIQANQGKERIAVIESAARLRMFDWDLRGNVLRLSGDAAIFGLGDEAWRGYESWMAAIHPGDRAYVERTIARALERRESVEAEFRVVWPDGHEHWLGMKSSIICDDAQAPVRMTGIFVDVTEQKATEEALIRGEKLAAAGRLAATIAHEINNPLAALTNLLYIVRGDRTLSRAGAQYLELAQEELSRVSRLARQALGFYKEQTTASSFSIPDLLEDVLALYRRNMPANIMVEKHYGENIEVRGVRGEIWQVFANVISNAVYALGEGGRLTVEASAIYPPSGRGMEVRIGDDGPGITADNVNKVFQPFFTTKADQGTGLGLWIAKELVEAHGGTIELQSRTGEQDHGTTLVVFLPAAAERIAAQPVAASEAVRAHG